MFTPPEQVSKKRVRKHLIPTALSLKFQIICIFNWEWISSLASTVFGWQYISSQGWCTIIYAVILLTECLQEYRVGLNYFSAGITVTLDQVRALAWKASSCRYHLRTECEGVSFHSAGFWVAYNNDEIQWNSTAGTFCLNSGIFRRIWLQGQNSSCNVTIVINFHY